MPEAPLTIGVVAGEASGDLLGAHLIRALRARLPQSRFTGIGGPRMQAAGLDALYPMEKLAVRGYVEVLRHYLEIVGIRRSLMKHYLADPPALFVGVDAPDFNLGLELKLHAAGIPTAHFVSPSIWAWRGGRIRKIKRAVSRMLAIFPFEQPLYEQAGIPVTFVGHPFAEMLAQVPNCAAAREQLRLPAAGRIIALLPGSRVHDSVGPVEGFPDGVEDAALGRNGLPRNARACRGTVSAATEFSGDGVHVHFVALGAKADAREFGFHFLEHASDDDGVRWRECDRLIPPSQRYPRRCGRSQLV